MGGALPWVYDGPHHFPAYLHRGRDEHEGHWQHTHISHVGLILCSCGANMGTFSYVLSPDDEMALSDPGPCPRCRRDRKHALWRARSVLVAVQGRRTEATSAVNG